MFLTKWNPTILRDPQVPMLLLHFLPEGCPNRPLVSKTKSWLWHRRLSHLNFGAINHLVRQGLVRGLPKLKFEKDHLCSACAMGKSIKKTHKPKSEDTNQEKLYLLHMDLCGPMRQWQPHLINRAFLVTADVPEIYMQEFWTTAKLHQHSIRFEMDTRKHVLDLEAFREMLHISPRIPGQPFDEFPFEEEILEFLRKVSLMLEILSRRFFLKLNLSDHRSILTDLQGTFKRKWRYLIPAITPIHNHMLIPNYQDFKIQDFHYSDGFECFQAINIGRYEHVSLMSLKHKKDEITR
nr:Gag-Pol polyprotein [Tanacetum cinerariifolium]